MSKITPFSEFSNESIDRLRDLGLAPKAPVDERWMDFVNEWSGDPEIDQLLTRLKARSSELIQQFIDDEDRESDEWNQIIEWMSGSAIDDIGIVEWLVYNNEI